MHVGLAAGDALGGREATDVVWVRMRQENAAERSFV